MVVTSISFTSGNIIIFLANCNCIRNKNYITQAKTQMHISYYLQDVHWVYSHITSSWVWADKNTSTGGKQLQPHACAEGTVFLVHRSLNLHHWQVSPQKSFKFHEHWSSHGEDTSQNSSLHSPIVWANTNIILAMFAKAKSDVKHTYGSMHNWKY